MSLFGSIQLASNAMQAQQIGLQVVGQNIANANTPGYSREELQLTPSATATDGGVLTGMGVQIQGVVQDVNEFLNGQLWSANADAANGQTQQTTYQQLEGTLNALGTNSIGSQLDNFMSSINNVLDTPDDESMQNLAVLQGQSLAQGINTLSTSVDTMRSDLDQSVQGDVANANQLITQIATLNSQIAQIQGGSSTNSQAVGLLDQRNEAINQLSQLINIKTEFQPTGYVNIYSGGNYLVFQGQSNQLTTQTVDNRGVTVSNVVIAGTNAPIEAQSGEIAGLITSRDSILGGFEDQLNQFAGTLASEFNKIYSSGQGTSGYQAITSTAGVGDSTAPLENAGLAFTPTSGSFDLLVSNNQTGETQTTNIPIVLNGLGSGDTTLDSLAASINQVQGLQASITPGGNLTISSTSPNLTFAFSNDTSGTLAALGLNTFFTGSTASDLSVNSALVADPTKFAASTGGVGNDTNNAVTMAGFLNQPLDSLDGGTITDLNNQMTAGVTEGSAQSTATNNGYQAYQQTLVGEQSSISGVNIDQETVSMLQYQRAYQASAQFISTINQLLNTLVQVLQ
ncbi:MAG TPA: flagellar hook-associated protein FlgK [Pirellulales bacterium]